MTREEFIGIAADGILRAHGHDPAGACPGFARYQAVEDATAALEAVGAWDSRLYVEMLAQGECAYASDCLTDNKQGACVFCGARAVLAGTR